MIELKNKYSIGCLVMFYEIEMFPEYIDGCIQMVNEVIVKDRNKITFDFCWNVSQYLEDMDAKESDLTDKFNIQIDRLKDTGCNINVITKTDKEPIFNIPGYRRDFNERYCELVDYLLWGETDSFWPKQTFECIESIDIYAKQNNVNRHLITFAYRKMWDDSWKPLEPVDFTDKPFIDTPEWNRNAEESPKSYMTLERMNEINQKSEDDGFTLQQINYPKFDGSCLVISSELIKGGVNIPRSLMMCAEDTSLGSMALKVLGNQYIQFIVKNVLRVHNRRHPNKRYYIKGEDNREGYIDKKGDWWGVISKMSKHNEAILFNNQQKFYTYDDFFKETKKK